MLLPTTQLLIGKHKAQVEVAATDASRSYGLMYRQSLPPDHGMLFVFDQSDMHCFWMKNTPLPLSVAFIGDDGIITNIARMQPRTEAPHCPSGPIRYALEMEQGWFAQRGLGPGTRVTGLPQH
jgi:uncharacterized membrane protein (UPF0127 family)